MKIISLVILVILSGNLSVFCQSEQFPNLEFTIQKTDIDGPISVINVHGDYYSGNCYQYKKREYLTGDLKMYDAITSKNIQMIKQLISEGYDLTIPIFTKDFSDVTTDLPDINFGFISRGLILKNMENDGSVDLTNIFYKIDNNGYTIASVKPTAAVKTTVLEYAKQINDDGIISLFKAEIENQLQAKRRQDSLRSANYTEKIKSGFNEIIPGKGFNSFEIGKTTLQEIINELGMNYKLEKDNFIKLYTYHYSELGVSFYFIGNKKTNKLYRIELTGVFKKVCHSLSCRVMP